jgi:hypothetical protein
VFIRKFRLSRGKNFIQIYYVEDGKYKILYISIIYIVIIIISFDFNFRIVADRVRELL